MKSLTPEMSWIGAVGRPHGVRGDFFLAGRSELLCLESAGEYSARMGPSLANSRAVTIARHQVVQGRDLLHLREIADRTQLEACTGESLWLETQLLVDPYAPWRGCAVLDAQGQVLGCLREFVHHGATCNAQIESPSGAWLEVPFVEAYFCLDADRARSQKQMCLTVDADILEDLWDRST